MHHYPHHIGDYRTHTAHLTMLEDGAYRRLLDIYYMHEKPLPPDIAAVQRLASARTKEERGAVEGVLREFFRLEDDGWHQGRCDEELIAYQSRADTARENGKNGGRPKTRKKPKHKPTDNPPGYSRVSETPVFKTQTEPSQKLTVNREPLSGEPPKGLPPDEHQKSSPVAAREDGPNGAVAHAITHLASNLKAIR